MRKIKPGKMKAQPRLVGVLHDNWDADAKPGIVMNPKARLVDHLTWTWSEARALEKIAEKICSSDDPEVSATAGIFLNRLAPISEQLKYLVSSLRAQ